MDIVLMFVVGLLVGTQINRAIYRLAWQPREIGPWSKPSAHTPPRHWSDRLPVLGWLGLARESPIHGNWFWLRPIAIELACAVGLALLYQFEMARGLHDWTVDGKSLPLNVPDTTLYAQFASHSVMFALMTVATFIDFDEKTIPDWITIPGTILGLLFAGLLPHSLLPSIKAALPPIFVAPDFLRLTSPYSWADSLDGPWGLAAGLACLGGWWYALVPKRPWRHQGWWRGLRFLGLSIIIHPLTRWLGWLVVILMFGTTIGWWQGGTHWQALLSSLVGLAFGVGLVWAFRVVASSILQQEALGFGDVTLTGMIGAFLGWQAALLVFFMAPFAGAVIAIAQVVITGKHEIAFGPYLCFSAACLVIFWNSIWMATEPYFLLGHWIPLGLIFCLLAMAIMLKAYLALKQQLFSRR